ncbi:MAG: hypothetical protein CMJ83_15015 [Planctomycetes bacterium]|nr:hypothetical protein [Planctomycetota bacterium]
MSDVRWLSIDALWLLWLLPITALLAVFAHQRTRRAALRFVGDVMTHRLMPDLSGGRPVLRAVLFASGLGLAVIALARPSWDFDYKKITRRGVDVVVALDVSRSMLADDGGEPRLERAKAAIADLVQDLSGDRFGLLAFAGEQVVTCPLTYDRGYFMAALRTADPSTLGRGGTRIGPALDRALKLLDREHGRDKVVILVTDAGDQDSLPKAASASLAKKKVRVISLGIGRVGSNQQAPLVIDGQVVRDRNGNPVLARVDEDLLRDIATDTRGLFIPPDQSHRLRALYRKYVDPLEKGEARTMQKRQPREQFQWFLLPGLLLLLIQAGLTPYRRRRVAGSAGAVAGLLACVLVTTGCSDADDAEAVRAATAALREGDATAAVTALEKVREDREDDPVVLYDLACAYQGAGRMSDARRLFGQVMAIGEQSLRARAECNLAVLDLADLKDVAIDAEDAGNEVRAEIRGGAGRALDRFQRARDLDPTLEEAEHKQDVLARWLRVVEDQWAAADRASRRRKRRERKGVMFLRGLIDAQEEIARELKGGQPMHRLALDQKDLVADLELIEAKIGDKAPAVSDGEKAAILEDVAAIKPLLETVVDELANARTESAVLATGRAKRMLIGVVSLWAELGDAVQIISTEHGRWVQRLPAIAKAPAAARTPARLRPVTEVFSELTVVLERVQERVPEADPEKVHVAWLALARTELKDAVRGMREVADQLGKDLGEALPAATTVQRSLERLVVDWQMSKQDAAPLARTLEDRQRALALAIASADPFALGTVSVASRFRDQTRRIGYLDDALRKAVMKDAPEKPTEEQAQALEKRLNALLAKKTAALSAEAAAAKGWADGGFPPDEIVVGALHTARTELRELWVALSTFEETLEAAAKEQQRAAQVTAAALETAGTDDSRFPQEVRDGPLSIVNQAREQALVTDLAHRLVERLPQELKIQQAKAPGVDAKEPASAEALEAGQVAQALEKAKDLIESAHGESVRATTALTVTKPPAKVSELRGHLDVARPAQVHAAELLAEALEELKQARLKLPQIARIVMAVDAQVLPALRDLAAGLEPSGEGPRDAKAITSALELAVTPVLARLPAALAGALAGMQPPAQQGEEPTSEQKQQIEQAKAGLTALTDQLRDAQGRALKALQDGKAADARAALDVGWAAARQIWSSFSDLKSLLQQGIAEQTQLIASTEGFRNATEDVPDARRLGATTDQGRTRDLIPIMEEVVKHQAGQGDQGGGGGEGMSEEVVKLAKKNLPFAHAAMDKAIGHLGENGWSASRTQQEKAKRLLEEILRKIQEEEQKQDQQDEPQPQPQPDDRNLTPDESKRLRRAVEERSQKMEQRENKHRKRTPVKEDW